MNIQEPKNSINYKGFKNLKPHNVESKQSPKYRQSGKVPLTFPHLHNQLENTHI